MPISKVQGEEISFFRPVFASVMTGYIAVRLDWPLENHVKIRHDVWIFESSFCEHDDSLTAGLSGAHPGFLLERG
jgi:hypothetical protein